MKKILPIAAWTAFSGVILGAFGAHALKDQLVEAGMEATWKTAVLYHLIHAVAMWATGLNNLGDNKLLVRASWCWWLGILLFSGSLYALALGGPRFLGPITPVGGLAFLLGWYFAARAGSAAKNP